LFTAFPYAMLRGEDLPVQSEWIVFVVVLALLGILSLLIGVLPRSLIARIGKRERDDTQLFAVPLKTAGWFAAIAYLVALFAHFAPHTWNLNSQLMLAVCPLYLVKMTIDPSPLAIFFLLGPLNAGVFGSVGIALGYGRLAMGRRTSSRTS